MIGFFEHQYLSYRKNHIKNLFALAKADGTVHEKSEIAFCEGVVKKFGMKKEVVRWLFSFCYCIDL